MNVGELDIAPRRRAPRSTPTTPAAPTAWPSCGTTARRTSAPRRRRCSPPPIGSGCGGSPTTGPATAARRRRPAHDRVDAAACTARRARRPRHRAVRGDGPLRWRLPRAGVRRRCSGRAARPSSASPGSPRSTPTGSTGSPGWRRPGQASLRAAAAGRAAKEARRLRPRVPTTRSPPTDMAALAGEWGWLGSVVRPAIAGGPGGLIDDDLAYVAPWGCDAADIAVPGAAAPRRLSTASCRWTTAAGWPPASPMPSCGVTPDDGHLSVLGGGADALAWIRDRHPTSGCRARPARTAAARRAARPAGGWRSGPTTRRGTSAPAAATRAAASTAPTAARCPRRS